MLVRMSCVEHDFIVRNDRGFSTLSTTGLGGGSGSGVGAGDMLDEVSTGILLGTVGERGGGDGGVGVAAAIGNGEASAVGPREVSEDDYLGSAIPFFAYVNAAYLKAERPDVSHLRCQSVLQTCGESPLACKMLLSPAVTLCSTHQASRTLVSSLGKSVNGTATTLP